MQTAAQLSNTRKLLLILRSRKSLLNEGAFMSRRIPCLAVFAASILLLMTFTACGGGSSSNNNGSSGGSGTVAIAISPTTATVPANGTQQFTATITGSSNTAVTWQVNNVTGGSAANGTISTTGLYTAPPTMTNIQVTVTAVSSADSTKSASAVVSVTALPAGSVMISPSTATVAAAGTQQFTATVNGENNNSVTWSVDGVSGGNGTVGTVSSSGLYTAPSASGNHMVTATSVADPNQSASATVSVVLMTLMPTTASLAPNSSQQFTANVQGTNNTSVTWSVNGVTGGNNTVGTISSSGLYMAPASPGSFTVTATSAALPNYSVTAAVTVTLAPPGTNSMLTYRNDDIRDGANLNETTLNPSNVNSQQFGKLFTLTVDAQVYAQPLYLPNITIGGAQHNVLYVATENDTVYAFDADGLSGQPLWSQHLDSALHISDDEGISPLEGITSTPVIDPTTGTIYVLTDGNGGGHQRFLLHALDITTGSEKFGGPVAVTGTVPGTGYDSQNGEITLESSCYQRNGLALDPASNGIYITFGHCSHGWILSYDKASLQQTGIINLTPDGGGAGLWGGAPSIDDSTGDLYIISGVDLDDPLPGYNDSALRLGTDLSILDYFEPSNEMYLSDNDVDFGSGGAIIMPDNPSQYPHELIGGGKDGRIFVMNRDNMGGYQMNNQVIQTVQTGTQQNDNIFSTPTFWNGSIYYHCAQDVVKQYYWYSSTGLLSTSPVSQGSVTYGGHGANTSISANGTSDAILWDIDTSQAQNGGAAVLHAYSATNLAQQLYNSSQAGSRDTAGAAVKFAVPTIVDGRVYIGTATEVDVYGLLSQ
jgi:Bacterial Ig-like domain (group 2)